MDLSKQAVDAWVQQATNLRQAAKSRPPNEISSLCLELLADAASLCSSLSAMANCERDARLFAESESRICKEEMQHMRTIFEERANSEREIERLKIECEETRRRAAKAEAQTRDLEEKVSFGEQTMEMLRAELKQVRDQLIASQIQTSEKMSPESLQMLLREKEIQRGELEEQVRVAQQRAKDVENRLMDNNARANEQVKELKDRLKQVEMWSAAELERLSEKASILEISLEQEKGRASRLSDKLKKERDRGKSDRQHAEERFAELQQALKEAELHKTINEAVLKPADYTTIERGSQQQKISRIEEELRNENNKLASLNATTQEEIALLKERLRLALEAAMKKDDDRFVHNLEESEKVRVLEQRVEDLEAELRSAHASYALELRELANEIDVRVEAEKKLRKQQQQQPADKSDAIETLKDELNSVKMKLRDAEMEINRERARAERLQADVFRTEKLRNELSQFDVILKNVIGSSGYSSIPPVPTKSYRGDLSGGPKTTPTPRPIEDVVADISKQKEEFSMQQQQQTEQQQQQQFEQQPPQQQKPQQLPSPQGRHPIAILPPALSSSTSSIPSLPYHHHHHQQQPQPFWPVSTPLTNRAPSYYASNIYPPSGPVHDLPLRSMFSSFSSPAPPLQFPQPMQLHYHTTTTTMADSSPATRLALSRDHSPLLGVSLDASTAGIDPKKTKNNNNNNSNDNENEQHIEPDDSNYLSAQSSTPRSASPQHREYPFTPNTMVNAALSLRTPQRPHSSGNGYVVI